MKKQLDPVVKQETLFVAGMALVFSVLMEAVFLALGAWDITVLLGNLLGYTAGVGNFFLMCWSVQRAVQQEGKDAKESLRLSHMLRTLALFGLAVLAVVLPCFHTWAGLIPLFFPTLAIRLQPLILKEKGEEP